MDCDACIGQFDKPGPLPFSWFPVILSGMYEPHYESRLYPLSDLPGLHRYHAVIAVKRNQNSLFEVESYINP